MEQLLHDGSPVGDSLPHIHNPMMATSSMYRNLTLVSPLCGPGFTAFWILAYVSLLLTWTLHRTKARQDQISIVYALAVIFPAVVGLHEAYLVYTYPGERANLSSWKTPRLFAANQAIFNDHTATRTNLLILCIMITPLCALRMHGKRVGLVVSPLGPLLLGHFATEMFLPREGEVLIQLLVDARGHRVWVRSDTLTLTVCVLGLEYTVLALVMHLGFLLRALWRRYHHRDIDYLGLVPRDVPPHVPWVVPPGWRGYLYMAMNSYMARRSRMISRMISRSTRPTWTSRVHAVILGVCLPCLTLWVLVPIIAADYQANLQSMHVNHGFGDKLAALRLTLLPRSNYSIWNWQQMSFLVLGLAALIYAVSDIWAERNSSGHIVADLDLKDLESDTKRDG
jgi:hypothetical protein